jgi:hypothetical protein
MWGLLKQKLSLKQKFPTTVYPKQVLSWRKEVPYFTIGAGLALNYFTSVLTQQGRRM